MLNAVIELRPQWKTEPLPRIQKLSIHFFGNHAGIDLDNAIGSVCDALVKAEVVAKDNLTVITWIEARWERSPNPKINIEILV